MPMPLATVVITPGWVTGQSMVLLINGTGGSRLYGAILSGVVRILHELRRLGEDQLSPYVYCSEWYAESFAVWLSRTLSDESVVHSAPM
jgi:hypothetical protein